MMRCHIEGFEKEDIVHTEQYPLLICIFQKYVTRCDTFEQYL